MSTGERDKVFRDKSPLFLEYLKNVGDIVDACTLCELNERTIEKWRKHYEDFDRAVESAFEQFRDTLPLVLINEAKKQLANAVFGRNAIVSSRITCTYDAKGELINKTEVIDTVPQGAQRWAIERVLNQQEISKAEQALRVLADLGYLPKTLTERTLAILDDKTQRIQELFTEYYPDSVVESQRGWSEELANQARHQILGTGDTPMDTIDIEAE